MSDNFDSLGKNAKGEDIDANGRASMEIGGRDAITIRQATDREIDAQIRRQNPDGTDWKIVFDDANIPSTYFLAARAKGYFGMSIRAVIIPLSQLEAWQRGVLPEPPKPRDDHMFDNKAAAFAWLRTLTPSIEEEFARDRNILVHSSIRSTGDVGMQSIKSLKERANPFR